MTESSSNIPQFVRDDLARLEISIDESELTQLAQFLDMLLDANTRMNLTAIRDRDAAWSRMIIDSLTLLPGLENVEAGSRVIDIGSGGGLPGIPLAIARPDLNITLLDATGKKVDFHNQAITTLELNNCQSIQNRAETLGQEKQHRAQYDLAVSRAIGKISEVLEYSFPLLKVGGRMLAMKGPAVEQELAVASDALSILGAGELFIFDAYPESFDNNLVVVSVLKESPTPKDYPRLPGIPKQCPL
ncbi:Ribosomal RNA small subunit methyltransferase G [Poriferisphaera corsica]|uniref:Ribosomal RNA small subunit methyltransferase G n=1 Tax=Poriferisphaera corsica TaxID=2528020 RepID=A0A517YUR4_9BACT|nr:16S rRNA (guanine(527)-N(7))-methyltransferase RsmG [Poriferisphaera corsica]QDU33955.1 Ribosomal RNA small subunit methyltransferase G [Poriferisphaera corsica]